MTSTASTTAEAIVGPARFMIPFADMLVSDIDPDKFADRCGTTINHPAFVLGHLTYYAGICMQMMGGEIEFTETEKELYEHGRECLDDPSLYPPKAEAIATFNDRVNTVADFLETCDESAFAKSSEGTWIEKHVNTMGGLIAFMMIGHVTFHLGQISAWRRVAGMGPAS